MEKAIIGGTGIYGLSKEVRTMDISTKYGDVEVDILDVDGEEIVFLARHGKSHSKPPHLVNYRANMMALKKLGVKYVYATAAVGSCNKKYIPGDIVIIKDFIDFTKSRPITFYEGENGVKHVDMSDPYCSYLRKKFMNYIKDSGLDIKGEAVYVCTEGPRFETDHEIKMYKILGGDVVGMTNVPEVVLAKELGICYSALGIITNWCTGMINEKIDLHDIEGAINKNKRELTKTFLDIFTEKLSKEDCRCKSSIIEL